LAGAVTNRRLLDNVDGLIITAVGESATIDIPFAVIVNGPELLFSTYVPGYITIATGLEAVDSEFAVLIAFARVKYGKLNDPLPVVSLPYFATYTLSLDAGATLPPLVIHCKLVGVVEFAANT